MAKVDYCKAFTVKIITEHGYGTGCLFQPNIEDYSYVLTAKHLFQNQEKTIITEEVNAQIEITRSKDASILNPQDLYHHDELDLTIIKVEPIDDLDDLLYSFEIPEYPNKVALYGYPKYRDNQNNGIEDKFLPDNTVIQYRNLIKKVEIEPRTYQNHGSIIGFSGCGVFEMKSNTPRLIGIEVSMADDYEDGEGRMLFIPLKEFNSITLSNNIAKLKPLYLSNFKHVVNKSFGKYPNALKISKSILQNLANNSIVDYITPEDILNIIDVGKALINNDCRSYLDHIHFWTVWLEFLVINRFMISNNPPEEKEEWMRKINKNQHFLFIETDDWTSKVEEIIDFWREKLEGNQSTLIISSYPDVAPIKATISKQSVVERINRVSITSVLDSPQEVHNISDGRGSVNYRLMHFYQFTIKIAEDISEFGKNEQEIIQEIKSVIEKIYNEN
ncbi:ABC-three component system protein [Psychroserpens luteus]|uniref:ABC-three component system protein n=1 Tax=Psychroserpens luteus TaxID=1434066 RepID=A0ABW5ZVA0_9FLAO|nr:ABC-three component system protein [Psychroserpens luteus]